MISRERARSKLLIIRFPGTNCDRDAYSWVEKLGAEPVFHWYRDQFSVSGIAGCILPGGFSYGDYLRSGALAVHAPVMKSVAELARSGRLVLGICNGMQILTESGLLPGAMVKNESGRFIDAWVDLVACRATFCLASNRELKIPIAHGDGRFVATPDELKRILDSDGVWLKYRNNPNGSLENIAGLCNRAGNVCGLMPHPERAMADWMGGVSGLEFTL